MFTLLTWIFALFVVEKISLGQGEIAEAFEPFEWDPNSDE